MEAHVKKYSQANRLSLTPGFSRVEITRKEKNRLNGFSVRARAVHRVETRC
jgi:hypothetical protein